MVITHLGLAIYWEICMVRKKYPKLCDSPQLFFCNEFILREILLAGDATPQYCKCGEKAHGHQGLCTQPLEWMYAFAT